MTNWNKLSEVQPTESKDYLVASDLGDGGVQIDVMSFRKENDVVLDDFIMYSRDNIEKVRPDNCSAEKAFLERLVNPLVVKQTGFYKMDLYVNNGSTLIKVGDNDIQYWAELDDISLPEGFTQNQNEYNKDKAL